MLFKIFLVALSASACCAAVVEVPPDVSHPCKYLSIECVRKNLALNSQCSPLVPGVAPASYHVPQGWFDTPFFRSSYEEHDLFVKGQDRCYISEFAYSQRAVTLGIDCPWLNFESDRTLYQHFSLREDNVIHYHINGTYPMIRLTLSLPNSNQMDICNQYTFAEVLELPIFHIDPKDKRSKDALVGDLRLLLIFEQEMFSSRASMLARTFINNVICNFNC